MFKVCGELQLKAHSMSNDLIVTQKVMTNWAVNVHFKGASEQNRQFIMPCIIILRCDMAFIEPMHRYKPNITYLLAELYTSFCPLYLDFHKMQNVLWKGVLNFVEYVEYMLKIFL